MFQGCRIGEARKPGPTNRSAGDHCWSIGACNPSGLQGKHCLVDSIQADILTVSESHLTARARDGFLSPLRGSKSKFRYMLTGAPLAPRVEGSDAGTWAGVAAIAQHPTRALSVDWPPDLYETGRIVFATSFIESVWVSGATIYGYPEGKLHPQARARTQDMVDFGLSRLLQTAGPKYLSGDWNFEIPHLAVFDRLASLGWQEVQTLESRRVGTCPENTCKHTSRKDFIWVSPELAQWFSGLSIDHGLFPDHSVLVAHFRGGVQFLDRFVWPTPCAVPWKQVPTACAPVDFAAGDPTKLYAQLWQTKETQAKAALGAAWQPHMSGRAGQTSPLKRTGWSAPVKVGRTSDFQPLFHGCNMQHSRWIKQLRRIQNFVRWRANHSDAASNPLHGIALWKSILGSPGFVPDFPTWWPSRSTICVGDVEVLPVFPPDHATALSIMHSFHDEVRRYERLLQTARANHRKFCHAQDPMLIFKDVKRPMPEPVTTLVQAVQATVVNVDHSEFGLELDRPIHLKEDTPVYVAGRKVDVVHAESDKVWISDLADCAVGQKLVQKDFVGSLPALFQAFQEQWKQRWCRHDQIPHSHWNTLLDFAAKVLPFRPVPPLAVTPSLILSEAHRKKKWAATGLDGVSRLDILESCPGTLVSLESLCKRAEADGLWPAQVVAGKVTSLAKRPSAESVDEYRPITVFSMLYRIWSSLQARHLLTQADRWASPGLYGNRPGRRATHMWHCLLSEIETARTNQQPLSGLLCDIEKAYNNLPRWPLLVAAMRVGTPAGVLNAWSGALASMVRHFRVRDNFSSGFVSSTGLAEGDGLSCWGMFLLDEIMHQWMTAQCPSIRVMSFVDDWSYCVPDATLAIAQLDHALEFCRLVDLKLDRTKTVAWSVDPSVRQGMRQAGLKVHHFTRELGAHLAFSRQFTNAVIKDRFRALDQFWEALKSSKASYFRKVTALRSVAWPRGLYGVSSAPIGAQAWIQLRRNAVAALNLRKAGVSPALLLGLVEIDVDPQLQAFMSTVRDARDLLDLVAWDENVFPYASGLLDLPPNAPSRILVDRLHSLGFRIERTGCVSDQLGSFDLLGGNFAELKFRVDFHWQNHVASEVAHRKTFKDVDRIDPGPARQLLAKLPPDRAALLRLGLVGGFFTEDANSHWTSSQGLCKWCGQPDSLRHRFWNCPNTQDLRDRLAPRVAPISASLLDVFTLHSWPLRPPSHVLWLSQLLSVPTAVKDTLTDLPSDRWTYVFTDGSCHFQTHPNLRFAAWSAVVASPFDGSSSWHDPILLGACPLPGLIQTAFRAELYALAFVLHHAASRQSPVVVWSDCLSVIRKYHTYVHGNARLKGNAANADLWQWVLASVRQLGAHNVQVRKVAAHQKAEAAPTAWDGWMTWHNNYADLKAKWANLSRPAEFWRVWELYAAESWTAQELFTEVWQLHLAVADKSIRFDAGQTVDEAPLPVPRVVRQFPQLCNYTGWSGNVEAAVCHEYGAPMMRRILKWWEVRSVSHQDVPVKWYSVASLYIDYQLSFGCAGPIKAGKAWLDPGLRRYLDPERFAFHVRLKWFRRCLKQFFRGAGIEVGFATCRPSSDVIQAFVQCVSVPWDLWAIRQTEHWLSSQVREPIVRAAKALKHLPLATLQPAMTLEGAVSS